MSRTVIALFLSLVVAVCAALWGWSEAGAARDKVSALETSLAASQARLDKTIKAVRTVEKKNAEYRADLARALEQNRDWAGAPVPAAVSDSLCKRGNCRTVSPVHSPGD